MAKKLPAPFTPPDCDLRGLPYMPLLGERLVNSDLFFKTTGDEFKAAVALWWASWQQVPAASLPDEPRVLAGLAKVYDARAWAKISAGALHGWVKCADGRLYHRTVADLALEAWDERQEHRANRESDTERKRRERDERKAIFADLKAAGIHLPWNTPLGDLRRAAEENRAKTVVDLSGGQVADVPDKEEEVEGTLRIPPKPPGGAFDQIVDPVFEKAWAAYPKSGRGTSNREKARAAFDAQLVAAGGCDPLRRAVEAYAASLAADGDRAKVPPAFHRWLSDRRFEAYLDASPAATPKPWLGPPELWAAVVTAKGEPFARSWLANCAWQDVPTRALISPNPVATQRLRQEVGQVLRSLDVQLEERAA